MDKIVIVVKGGMIQEVYGPRPNAFEIEIIDLDIDYAGPKALRQAERRLRKARQHLCRMD